MYRADGRPRVWQCLGEWVAYVNVVNRVPYSGGGVLVRAGIIYKHNCILLMAIWLHRDNVTRSWGPLSCHSSATITSYIMSGHVARICTQFPETENVPIFLACILTRHVTHWACLGCSGSRCMTACFNSSRYPATSHSHRRGVGQHSTINSLINSMQRVCGTAWGKSWSHQIRTGFLTHAPTYLWPTDAYLHS